MRRLLCLALLLILCLGLCGCAAIPGPSSGVSVTDDGGAAVILPVQPRCTAVLFSSFADIWCTAGGEVAVTVGESIERGFAAADVMTVDGGAGKSIDTEALLAARPDLVIGSADIPAQVQAVELCRSAGIPAVLLRVECFSDYLRVLGLFCRLTGRPELYAVHGEAVAAEIDALRAAPAEGTVLFIRAGSTAASTKAKGSKDHFAAAMLEELGMENIAHRAPVLLDGLSMEEILSCDPDRIFITTMGDAQAARDNMESLLALPEWQSLSAVIHGRVYYLPKELFQYKPNARWAEAYRYLYACIEQGKGE